MTFLELLESCLMSDMKYFVYSDASNDYLSLEYCINQEYLLSPETRDFHVHTVDFSNCRAVFYYDKGDSHFMGTLYPYIDVKITPPLPKCLYCESYFSISDYPDTCSRECYSLYIRELLSKRVGQ